MEVNELRIGNWVYHNPSAWSYRNDDGVISNYSGFNKDCFKWEESDWYALGESTLDISIIHPIPLTEEWLVRFGFELNANKYRTNDSKLICHKMIDVKISGSKYNLKHIKYVHQLQNLYFALTGEELKLKEVKK